MLMFEDVMLTAQMDSESIVFGITMIIMSVIMLVGCAKFALESWGLYSVAERRGLTAPWIAWFPLARLWILGSISDQYLYLTQGKRRIARFLLPGSMLVCGVYLIVCLVLFMNATPGIVVLACCAGAGLTGMHNVLRLICLYRLYRSCVRNDGIWYLLLTLFIPIIEPLLLIVCRNNDKGMPPRRRSEI